MDFAPLDDMQVLLLRYCSIPTAMFLRIASFQAPFGFNYEFMRDNGTCHSLPGFLAALDEDDAAAVISRFRDMMVSRCRA